MAGSDHSDDDEDDPLLADSVDDGWNTAKQERECLHFEIGHQHILCSPRSIIPTVIAAMISVHGHCWTHYVE